jgi:hypothetical protein
MVTLVINRKKKNDLMGVCTHKMPYRRSHITCTLEVWGVNGNFASKFTNCFNVDCFKLLFTAFTNAENNIKIVLYWQRLKLYQIPGDG